MATPPPLPEEYASQFRQPKAKWPWLVALLVGVVVLIAVSNRHQAPTAATVGDGWFHSPLKVGDVGRPYSFEVLSVLDESRAICRMRFLRGNSFTAVEKVLAFIPTVGIVSAHGYRFDKSGTASLATDDNKLKDEDAMVFEVTGTASFGGDAVFVVKPAD